MERGDIQRLLKKQIDIIDPNLYVLCEEFSSWEDSDRRIDLLCLDDQANLVVIELKRTLKDAHADLQAIRYAAMVSKMTYENVVSLHLDYLKKQFPQEEFSAEKAESLINDFIASKKLAEINGACVVKGSATPDVCSYFRAQKSGNLIELKERFNNVPLAPVAVVDMREEYSSKGQKRFSNYLIRKIEEKVV